MRLFFLQRSETKVATTSAELNVASSRTDEIAKAIKVLETKNMIDEGRKYFENTFFRVPA